MFFSISISIVIGFCIDKQRIEELVDTSHSLIKSWFSQETSNWSGYARFTIEGNVHHVYATEGIYDYTASHALNRVQDYGNSPSIHWLKAFLSLDVKEGEPASESGMWVIPTNDLFLFEAHSRKHL